ncbi:sigma factor-like helix-turn-helix DNA-binding protein [Polynucleobacter sp. 73C-SIWE]|uniref:sigma factor-like helix-turn-helix DNA-binding protein n=1 Tax=Polynucleobacter sp. 73C-SIWE TaxID=2689098 RepID=UPI0021053F9B|nr:sigma factor-like helix-turn-helix DNA-binding protein [Polynucleobacter sp. 73C-SIWE]
MTQASNKNTKRHRTRVWSLNSTYSAYTLHEVADMLGLTRERVRQIEAKALAKIRKRFQEQGLTASDLL